MRMVLFVVLCIAPAWPMNALAGRSDCEDAISSYSCERCVHCLTSLRKLCFIQQRAG